VKAIDHFSSDEVRGVLRGFAGRVLNGACTITKYYIQPPGAARPVSCHFDTYSIALHDGPASASGITPTEKQALINMVLNDGDTSLMAETVDCTKPADGEGNTTWTHQSRMCLYGWVAKVNPYKAPRGQSDEYWSRVAVEVGKSTSKLTKKEGRIDLNGTALRVYVNKQLGKGSKYMDYKAKVRDEASKSGQTGMLSSHEKDEYGALDQLASMKAEANEEMVAVKEHKDVLRALKEDQLNDAIVKKAMSSEAGQKELMRTLDKKRKKLEIKIDALKEAHKLSRDAVVTTKLSEDDQCILRRYAEVKEAARKGTGESGVTEYDSEDNANRGIKKRGVFHQTLAALQQVDAKASEPLPETPLERALQQWLQNQLEQHPQHPSAEDEVERRLEKLEDLKKRKKITEAEYSAQRSRILDSL
jgi:hypothetical protein